MTSLTTSRALRRAWRGQGIAFKSLIDRIDATSASGKLVFHIFCVLSFERNLIKERSLAGLSAPKFGLPMRFNIYFYLGSSLTNKQIPSGSVVSKRAGFRGRIYAPVTCMYLMAAFARAHMRPTVDKA